MNIEKLRRFVEGSYFKYSIITLIIITSIAIGFETSNNVMESVGDTLLVIDNIILLIIVLGIILKLYFYHISFFKSGCNII